MKTQKTIAVIMILTSSVLTWLVSGDIAYPAMLCMLGLIGLQRRFTWDFRPEKRIITSLLLLLLAIMFSLHLRYGSPVNRVVNELAAAVAWQTIARYFLASMILVLFLGSPERLPFSLGLFHVAVTISAGQVLLLDDRYVAFRLSELFSVILVVLYAAVARGSAEKPIVKRTVLTSRSVAFGLILILTANCGWVISSVLYRNVEVLNYLPLWFWRGAAALENTADGVARVGFSASGKLSSLLLMKGEQDPTPALSITCEGSPGYLRARAFEVYRRSEWQDMSTKEALFPEQKNPFGMYFVGRKNVFRLNQRDAARCDYMTVRHESQLADAVFTPLGTSFLEAPLSLLLRDDNDILHAPNLRSGLSYRIAYTKSPHRKPPTSGTTTEKIDAVIDYFHSKYTYSLGLDIPPDQDKLTHFLLNESTGYCEYFASGAAILLRFSGVPTRYVTGFLVTEKDPQSELWVARNMDAHAWTEAWDRERNQWTIVEATVGQDLAAASADEQLGGTGGGPGTLFGQFLQALYQYGLFGLPGWLFRSYGLLGGVLLGMGILGGVLWLVLSRHYKKSKSRTRSRALRDPRLAPLHKMLARMDRKVKRAGQQRHLSETLHAFAQRLLARDSGDGLWTKMSDWYLQYANLRYRKTITSKRLHHLQQLAKTILS
jgi:hypothetical protein